MKAPALPDRATAAPAEDSYPGSVKGGLAGAPLHGCPLARSLLKKVAR
jgi:hypothetical protein